MQTELFPILVKTAFPASLVLGALFLILFLRSRVKKASLKACAFKALTSIMFIAVWFIFQISTDTGLYGMCVGLGLIFGMLGDIWLDLKFCYPQDDDLFTKLGFGSFALGHFAYIAAVICGTVNGVKLSTVLIALVVAVVAGLVVYFGEGIMKLKYGNMKMISTLYGALLFFTTAFAFVSGISDGISANPHLFIMGIGGILFVISDLILSGTYFGEGKNRPVDIVTNHVSYYLAQYIIAASYAVAYLIFG